MQKPASNPWHYPRTAEARKFMETFEAGLLTRFALFSPRRMGKTEFLLEDVAPLAIKMGYTPLYVSMWENTEQPHLALLESLRSWNNGYKKQKKGIISHLLPERISKLGLNTPVFGGEVEFNKRPKFHAAQHHDEFAEIKFLLTKMCKLEKKVLLMVDEVQHLTDKRFEPFAHSLRTILDELRSHIRVIFTGSSKNRLKVMFNSRQGPFYEAAKQVDFPLLGRPFTDFICDTFKKVCHRPLDKDVVFETFQKLNYNPAYLVGAVQDLILNPDIKMEAAFRDQLAIVASNNSYTTRYEGMDTIDREIIMAVMANPKRQLYSGEQMARYKKAQEPAIGKEPVQEITPTFIQSRVRRLVKFGTLVPLDRGEYDIELPGFVTWFREHYQVDRPGNLKSAGGPGPEMGVDLDPAL